MKVTSVLFVLSLFSHSGSALRPSLGGRTVTAAAAGVRGVVATATRSPLVVLQQQELPSSRIVRTTTAAALSATAAAIRQQRRRELSRRGRNNNKNRLVSPMRRFAVAALLGISLSVAAACAVPPPAHAASIIEAFKSKNYEQIVARPNFASSSSQSADQTATAKQQRSRRVRVLTASGVVLGTTVVGVGNLKRKQQQQSKDEEEEEEKQREEAKESSPKEPRDAVDGDPQAVVTKKPFRLPDEMQMDNNKEDNADVDVDADEASNKSRYQATLEKLIRNSQAEHSQVPRVLLSNKKRKKKEEAAEDEDDSDSSSSSSDNNDNTPAPSAAARTVDFASAKAKIAQFFPSKAFNPNSNTRNDDDDEKEPTTATAVLGSTQPPLTPASSVVTANIAPATTNAASSISTTKSLAPLYSSVAQARQQPKPSAEEAKLQARYAAMDTLQDRAFQVLVDLGMVELTSSAGSDDGDDDEWQ